jgi:dethiobiotin synthetase
MTLKIFVTGTDTNVGKTYVSSNILTALQQRGYSTLGIKPIASGCILQDGKYINDDALLLQQASSIKLPYEQINPCAFKEPIAPHIAANLSQQQLSVETISKKISPALQHTADICLIEGAGGWHVPLNEKETYADFVIQHQFPVLLIVGLRLGCLNHAILTSQAFKQSGVNVIGWVANSIDNNMIYQEENIKMLKHWLPIPCLDVIPYRTHSINFACLQTNLLLARLTQLIKTRGA